MVSRRRLLQAGGAALAAALAGCQAPGDDPPNTESTSDNPTSTTPPSTSESAHGDISLQATQMSASDVEDGATVAVASPELHQLVVDAAAARERVDAPRSMDVGRDASLVLGWFAYVEFRGETYEASSSFEGFAGEAAYNYELLEANESQVEDERVVEYANLTADERDVADEMLENGSFEVGHHEQRPAAVEPFESQHYLQADNETYQIRVAVGDYAAHHMLTLDAADPGPDAQVVTVADRVPGPGWTDELRAAVQSGSTGIDGVADPESLAEYLDGVDYVVTATEVAEVELSRAVT